MNYEGNPQLSREQVLAIICGSQVGLLNLWDMTKHCIRELIQALDYVRDQERLYRDKVSKKHADPSPQETAGLFISLTPFREQIEKLKLTETLNDFNDLKMQIELGKHCNNEAIYSRLDSLLNKAYREIAGCVFTVIPSEKAEYFDNDNLFGEAVSKAFPLAVFDIKQAGNCLAANLNTAAVFHLMRTVEHGLRGLASGLSVTMRYPLEYADWGTVIGQIEHELEQIQNGLRGPAKSGDLEFYSGTLSDCKHFKETWRDAVMHSRNTKPCSEEEAKWVFSRVREFTQRLTTRGITYS